MRYCNICYEEVAKEDMFDLGCAHAFCKSCVFNHLESNIKDGKVTSIPCMEVGCEATFSDENVKKCSDDALYQKYTRFCQKIIVDLDPDLRWCPSKNCEKYVRRQGKNKTKATCECGTQVCMNCGELSTG